MNPPTRIIAPAIALALLAPIVTWSAGHTLPPHPPVPPALIHLGGYHGDPAADPLLEHHAADTSRLRLVQLTGPVRADWRERLEARSLQVLAYVPHNAYLVWADSPATKTALRLDETPFVRWHGAVPAEAKRRNIERLKSGAAGLMVLHVPGNDLPATIASLGGELERSHTAQPDGRLHLAVVRLAADRIPDLLAADGVVWVEPAPGAPELSGEMSSLIVSGSFDTAAPAPGYRTWLDDLGYDGAGVTWAVVDSGVDPLHPDLVGLDGISYPECETELPGDDPGFAGHGTPVAGILAGTGAAGYTDDDGFLWGLGVAPGVHLLSQNAICDSQAPWPPAGGWQVLSRDGLLAGSVGSNNSWNSQEGEAHGYQASERIHDLMVRDGNFDTPDIAEPYILVFNAGNKGPDPTTIPAPKEAKNLITVGAIENWRTDGNLHTVISYSSRGPTVDGRLFPNVVAPGEDVGGALHRLKGLFAGLYEIDGTDGYYAAFGGTSAAVPHVSGMLAVTTQWWRATRYSPAPSPAAARAMVVNAALPLAEGPPAPNFDSGWGLANLVRMIAPDDPVWIVDQTEILSDTGAVWTHEVEIADPSRPLQITLAWTDAAAAAGADPALVNDLDLTVSTGGASYLGNHFEDGWSVPEGDPDRLNNLEAVHLAAPGGTVVVTVAAANLPGDGIPYNGDLTDQDFALVCRNCLAPAIAPRRPSGRVAP
ncbi:MAG: S8 family serine peptidase [Thermoanaerobaculales bacterium]|nr:S8 family serine peptidase [Thermoanaerobaculales bacterium]